MVSQLPGPESHAQDIHDIVVLGVAAGVRHPFHRTATLAAQPARAPSHYSAWAAFHGQHPFTTSTSPSSRHPHVWHRTGDPSP